MIEIRHLSKWYGNHLALDDLSVTVEKGKIYGFLGPNGAGKSTTMNIIAGCLAASEGTVEVCGHDIFQDPIRAKRCIGYLPEIPPVYPDMTPTEYLGFIADARKIPASQRYYEIRLAMEKTGITHMSRRLIKNLSKGYRQRVGLAGAILGDPEVIILDEPTVGLDPIQIIEIRELITSLAEDHTVILSSHILSEVSAVCDRILIMSRGKLVANGTPEELGRLLGHTNSITMTLLAEESLCREVLAPLGAERLELEAEEGRTQVLIESSAIEDLQEQVARALAAKAVPVLAMAAGGAGSLEDIFLEVTQQSEGREHAQ